MFNYFTKSFINWLNYATGQIFQNVAAANVNSDSFVMPPKLRLSILLVFCRNR